MPERVALPGGGVARFCLPVLEVHQRADVWTGVPVLEVHQLGLDPGP